MESLVAVFEQVRRVLRKDGTLWIEVGDSFAGSWGNQGRKPERGTQRPINGPMLQPLDDERYPSHGNNTGTIRSEGLKPKDLIGQPFMLAFALREAGWYWRNVLIWHKPNPMPESVRDRFTVSHSYVLLFSKSPRYFFDAEAVREAPLSNGGSTWEERKANGAPMRHGLDGAAAHGEGGFAVPTTGRNARSVWTIPTEPLPFEHYAAFPQALAERCIKAGTSERGCCPECGAPWVRHIETVKDETNIEEFDNFRPGWRNVYETEKSKGDTRRPVSAIYAEAMSKRKVDRGWFPSCECLGFSSIEPQLPIPCTVLDPFLGSGTTALVARRLNRRCIGIELSEKYAALAAQRTQQLSLEAI